MSNRQVHARLADGSMIVRYDRSGKWYLEQDVAPRSGRRLLRIADAVELAAHPDAARYWGRNGGSAFDAKLRQRLSGAEAVES